MNWRSLSGPCASRKRSPGGIEYVLYFEHFQVVCEKRTGEVTMENQSASAKDIKATIHEEWRGAAPLWMKWYTKLSSQSRSATELVVNGAALSSGQHVLDLASGSGEPALSVAKVVGSSGRVVA